MKRILIIEDDPIITSIYRHKYEEAGYEAASAADGETGLQKVKDFKPDLVHLDLMLPKMNGVEVIREIRAQPEFRTMPIIVFSSSYLTDMIGEAMEAGANRCISKAKSTPKLLLDIVSELLKVPEPSPGSPVPPRPTDSIPPGKATSPAGALLETSRETLAPCGIEGETISHGTREGFLKCVPRIKAALRDQLRLFIKSHDERDRASHLSELNRSAHSLSGYAGMTGFIRISHIAGVLEVLLKELHDKPKQITPSTLRTVAHTVECLEFLFEEKSLSQEEFPQTSLILAVDDEPISRITLRTALDKAHLRAITLDDPVLALKVLAQNRFDLIFLDVDMPRIDGFELCKRIRASVTNKTTPVVFVTVLSDFESRTRSTLSGGNDLIAKPFLLVELAAKALTLLVKGILNAKEVRALST